MHSIIHHTCDGTPTGHQRDARLTFLPRLNIDAKKRTDKSVTKIVGAKKIRLGWSMYAMRRGVSDVKPEGRGKDPWSHARSRSSFPNGRSALPNGHVRLARITVCFLNAM